MTSRAVTRAVIGVVGLVTLAAGAITAWRAKSATALIVIGGVLLVLAFLDEQWDLIRGKWGDREVEVRRRTAAVLSAAEDGLDEIKELFPEVGDKIGSVGSRVTAARYAVDPDEFFARTAQGRAFALHDINGHHVRLKLAIVDLALQVVVAREGMVVCEFDGDAVFATKQDAGLWSTSPFETSPGHHTVRWYARDLLIASEEFNLTSEE